MRSYLLRRFVTCVITLFIIVTVTFALMKAVPGDPFAQEKAIPPEIMKSLYAHYKLDRPWYIQYLNYLKSVVTWNLGPSFKYQGRTVNDIINQGFPVSATLGLEALVLALCVGIGLGMISALYSRKWPDFASMILAIIGLSVPSFILAAFLQYILAMKLNLLPVARWGTFSQSIMPAISLAALPLAFIARLTRSTFTEVLHQDYIKLAKAKGLPKSRILFKHTLRNGCLPVASYFGPLAANVLTGSFVVEQIFGVPGLGQWFVTSIINRDYTVIMGTTVFYSIILLVAVLLMDILYCRLDPRIEISRT